MASSQVAKVLEVGDMNMSQALVCKYHAADQVQEISRGSPNIGT